MKKVCLSRVQKGFTIIEILVVIVVIAILAAITIATYNNISGKATAAVVQSDLSSAAKMLKAYNLKYGSYPFLNASLCPTAPSTVDNNFCLKSNSGTTLAYSTVDQETFLLTGTQGTTKYEITESTTPTVSTAITCPTGFIVVPGSATYGTSDFCVMKFEAKNVGGIPTSVAAGTNWGTITQPNSITTAETACSGCHLITEAEWLTIAQNVMLVASNWTGGVVGSGEMYVGHTDNSPTSRIAGSTDDNDGYYLTGNTAPSNQRRTLTLSNGEVIWDFVGNAYEWTQGQTLGGQPGVLGGGMATREWNAVTTHGTLSPDPYPATAYAAAASWGGAQGIGRAHTNADDTTVLRPFLRSGYVQSSAGNPGPFYLCLTDTMTDAYAAIGFRVTK